MISSPISATQTTTLIDYHKNDKQMNAVQAILNNPGDEGPKLLRSAADSRKLYENASTPEEKKAKKVADEFIATLFNMLFKEMDKTIERTGFLDGGEAENMFRSFVHDEYAKQASSQSGFGLNHRIYENLYESTARRVEPGEIGKAAVDKEISRKLDIPTTL
ncbi:MAG: rod-binding protein [Candidatus Lindowbacteria bacterium]|nr:rod-binding protein [Candidatus Lindowbacteria bacterium]